MAARNELLAKLDVVVNLTVADDPQRAVFVAQRLRAAIEIDDGKPIVCQKAAVIEEQALPMPVGAAMPEQALCLVGPGQVAIIERVIRTENSVNSTHGYTVGILARCWSFTQEV